MIFSPRTPTSPSRKFTNLISENANGLIIMLSFCVVSSAIVIHNKYLLDRKQGIFPHSMVLMWLQTVVAMITLCFLQISKILKFSVDWSSPGDWLTGIVYVVSVFSGLLSLSFVTIPIFSAL